MKRLIITFQSDTFQATTPGEKFLLKKVFISMHVESGTGEKQTFMTRIFL
jgi:hypothetical protein